MALNKTGLKNSIKSLMQDMMKKEDASIDEFAGKLSDAVDTYVKTGSVSVSVGIPVQVAPETGTGATTGPGTGTIS